MTTSVPAAHWDIRQTLSRLTLFVTTAQYGLQKKTCYMQSLQGTNDLEWLLKVALNQELQLFGAL